MDRPQYYRFNQGQKQLLFADTEYESRLKILRRTMQKIGVDAAYLYGHASRRDDRFKHTFLRQAVTATQQWLF